MNSLKVYTTAGIITLTIFLISATVMASEVKMLASINPISTTLLIASIMFTFVLYFRLIVRSFIKIKEHKRQLAKKKAREELVKQKEGTEKKEQELAQSIQDLASRLFSNIEGINTPHNLAEQILKNFADELEIVQGLAYIKKKSNQKYTAIGNYAYYSEDLPFDFKEGEGITGQAAKDKEILNISNIPDDYIMVLSGLGISSPNHLLILPFVHQDDTVAILEVTAFTAFPKYIVEACQLYNKKVGEIFANLADTIEK